MTREEAAALLGLAPRATPDEVRRAWRMWARAAHPDAGGDADHFARLEAARRTLLQPAPSAPPPFAAPEDDGRAWPAPAPRAEWTTVLRRPRRPRLLAGLAVVTVLLGGVPALAPAPVAVLAVPVAVAAAAWAVVAAQAVLTERADPGHRMTTLLALWAPVAAGQVAVSVVAGGSLVPVLPLLALPLVAAVASVNPGAGLWRPIGASTPRG